MMLWRKKVTSNTERVCEFECEGVSGEGFTIHLQKHEGKGVVFQNTTVLWGLAMEV